MCIQKAIEQLQLQNPHLHIQNIYTDETGTGYVRISFHHEEGHRNDGRREDKEAIARVALYLDEHLSENVKMEQLAHLAHMSQAKLKYTFFDVMHCSVREYKAMLRLRKAIWLLQSGEDEMEKIAFQLGYKKAATFAAFFRQHMLMTPQEYREIMKK